MELRGCCNVEAFTAYRCRRLLGVDLSDSSDVEFVLDLKEPVDEPEEVDEDGDDWA